MQLGLEGKVAVVCGGSRGMGEAISRQLAEENTHVAVIARNEERLEELTRELDKLGEGRILPISLDLSRIDQIPEVINYIESELSTIHILINNAGGPPPGTFLEVSDKDWEHALTQNLKSTISFTKQVVPFMQKQNFGRIISITSQVVKEPPPSMVLSNTARAGVVAFAKTIASELAPFNITVNTLCPGPIQTGRMKSLIEKMAEKSGKEIETVTEEIREKIPMKRMGEPKEFANVAVFLASEAASFITGTTLTVDGGITKSLL